MKDSIRKLIDYGADFMVLLVGGSYSNPGLRNKIEAYMNEIISTATKKGIRVKYSFLHDQEPYPYVLQRALVAIRR